MPGCAKTVCNGFTIGASGAAAEVLNVEGRAHELSLAELVQAANEAPIY
jgi:hypothetical protein